MKSPKTADELRQSFLKFFESKNHLIMPSSSLIPSGDPTLLLTNSGMAQFKAYFSGEKEPPQKRITTAQKCFRTTDIEEVGDDTHLTLFEMLGNFSFGDYFKKEACEWALEFMVDILGFEKDRLFFTIYKDDDESKDIWLNLGIEEKYIYKFGDEDNWWGPAGDEGPCGPCSELHYYQGDKKNMEFDNPKWGPNLHDDFVELYNLVFTQFYRDLDGNDKPLPFNNIDTGMGLERTVSVLNNQKTAYKTDIFSNHLEMLNDRVDNNDDLSQKFKRIIAEHGRSASFLIADGVLPENTGRGYVLRRLIRRAMVTSKKLNLDYPVLSPVADITSKKLSHVYPELSEKLSFIKSVLDKEEENFNRTLSFGTQVLYELINKRNIETDKKIIITNDAKEVSKDIFEKINSKENKKLLSGIEAFILYDTYGFPIEITSEICEEFGLLVDKESFNQIMEDQKDKSKKISNDGESEKIYSTLDIKPTEFVGFETLESKSQILAIIKDNEIINGPSFQYRNNEIGLPVNEECKHNIVFKKGRPRFKKKLNGKIFSLLTGGGGNQNYWHWLFDVLPRLGILEKSVKDVTIDYYLFPDLNQKFQKESLDLLNIHLELLWDLYLEKNKIPFPRILYILDIVYPRLIYFHQILVLTEDQLLGLDYLALLYC